MTPTIDPAWDQTIAQLSALLRARSLEAYTRRGQTLIIKPRRMKRSKLTGELR
ncbi:hypothetical protein [Synechococcus phage Ssp-JY38]|nr:hypothetical protein [Synechococcus phage Yong-L2-223]